MAKEYIEREAVWQKIFNHCEVCVKLHNAADCNDCILDELKDELYEIPAADVRPVVHARWRDDADKIDRNFHRHDYFCSACNTRANAFVGGTEDWYDSFAPNYCPNCGADMREVENG